LVADRGDRFVADTSALAAIREIERIGKRGEKAVFDRLRDFVADGRLVYPTQVIDELEQYRDADEYYRPYEWARENRARATRYGPLLEVVAEILRHPQIKNVLDHEKGEGAEEADPHVLALALRLKREGHEVTVLTQERRDRPRKLSLNTACGLLRIFCLPVEAFLVEHGIIPPR